MTVVEDVRGKYFALVNELAGYETLDEELRNAEERHQESADHVNRLREAVKEANIKLKDVQFDRMMLEANKLAPIFLRRWYARNVRETESAEAGAFEKVEDLSGDLSNVLVEMQRREKELQSVQKAAFTRDSLRNLMRALLNKAFDGRVVDVTENKLEAERNMVRLEYQYACAEAKRQKESVRVLKTYRESMQEFTVKISKAIEVDYPKIATAPSVTSRVDADIIAREKRGARQLLPHVVEQLEGVFNHQNGVLAELREVRDGLRIKLEDCENALQLHRSRLVEDPSFPLP